MMKNHTKTVGALAAATAMVTGYAMAGEPAPAPPPIEPAPARDFFSGEVHVGYNSMYEFRFVDLGQDMAEAGVDLAFDLGAGWGISAGAWYASTNDVKNSFSVGSFNELDLYAGVGWSGDWIDLELGYIFYYFPDKVPTTFLAPFGPYGSADTSEIYLSVGFNLPWEIGLNATGYYDIDRYSGLYVDFQLTKSFAFTECLGLDLAAGVGYADGHGAQLSTNGYISGNPGATRDGYQGWYISAAMPWEFIENVTISPYIKYTNADNKLISDLKGTSWGKDYLFGGVMLNVAF